MEHVRQQYLTTRTTRMTSIGIIICDRYKDCGGGKCFRAMRERLGGFARYDRGENLELVGYAHCGGCPGGNIESVPAEFARNGCDVIHFATGMIVGYPPCPYIRQFQSFIETQFGIPVVVGTHPIPLKYMETHARLGFWDQTYMKGVAGGMFTESREIMERYN